MKRRILGIVLSAVMMCSLLSGCGKSDETDTTNVSNAMQVQEDSKDEGSDAVEASGDTYIGTDGTVYKKFDDVKLTMLINWNGGFKTATDQYNNEVAAAIREKIGVTVEFEGIMMSETEKLNLMFASGDMPDIINAPYWGGTGGETAVIKKAGSEGRLYAIEDLLDDYPHLAKSYNIGVISEAFLDNDLDYDGFEGHRYLIPQETAGDIADITNWGYGVFVRGDVLDTLGVDGSTIKTYEDLYDLMVMAKEYGFKDVNGNDCIVATTYHEGWGLDQYQINFDQKKTSSYTTLEDGTLTYDSLTEEWVEKNLFIWKLVNEGLLDVECFKHTDAQADEKVGNGTALFAAAQYSVINNSTKLTGLYASNPELRYIPIGPMTYKDGSPLVQVEQEGRGGTPAIFFPSDSENIEAALTWLDFMNSEEGLILSKYGIEGDTFAYNEDGQPRLNADLLQRKAEGDATVDEELRQKGISYMHGRTLVADTSYTLFGEKEVGDADAADPNVEAYKLLRPVEQIPGYALNSLVSEYENYAVVSSFAFEGTTETDYKQRSYFAATEEEARQILLDYQEYLMTKENGIFQDYLEFVNEIANSHGNVAR